MTKLTKETKMTRISAVDHETATGKAKDLLDGVKAKLGFAPNLMKAFANSPVALEAYLGFNATLGKALNAKLREEIALITAEQNGCGYCASAHTALGKAAGLSDDETIAARGGVGSDNKKTAALTFAKAILEKRGSVSDDELAEIRSAGYTDGEITEIVGHVALNVLTNYFNNLAETEIDFPVVSVPLSRSAAI